MSSRGLLIELLEQRSLLASSGGLIAGFTEPATQQPELITAELQAEGEGEFRVRFRFETADVGGNPVSQFNVGDAFDLNVFV